MPTMRARTWKIIRRGDVPESAATIAYTCPHCGIDAELPVLGLALAQLASGGLVFDIGPHAMPSEIECRACRHRFGSTATD